MKIVGVAACPTGIAHTYMAAENIVKECKRRGFEIKMETQGSIGIEDELLEEEIEEADFVLLGISIGIDGMERFDEKIVFQAEVSDCVAHPEKVVDDALKFYEENK